MIIDLEDRLRKLLAEAAKETDSERLSELVEEIYRLLDASKKAPKPS